METFDVRGIVWLSMFAEPGLSLKFLSCFLITCCNSSLFSPFSSSLMSYTVFSWFGLIIIIIIIKKDWQCNAGRGSNDRAMQCPISPKTPALHFQHKEEKKRKEKYLMTKKERITRPTKRSCSWNPSIPHHRIRGQPDRSREIGTEGGIKSCSTARFCSGEVNK